MSCYFDRALGWCKTNHSPHTSGLTNKTSWERYFVNALRRADFCNQKWTLAPALMFILQTGLSTSTGSKKKKALHVNSKVTLTVNGNFCSSMSRYEHDLLFNSPRRPPFTYIHFDGAEAGMRRTPRHRHAKQLHERPNYLVHTCWQYIGEVRRQTLSDRQSKL